ncbi:hypothetical protein LSTR_LSTR003494 [Laodelphax striatellus]|uniref:asparagine--tRNA ligase n=1 Tax=Laodelphax striatellus TaxID=195883 RepID=A0A482WYU8_LAOST|nr:hypothetical protein LSTR_LSTR003494 [Laodelphax striatellus]
MCFTSLKNLFLVMAKFVRIFNKKILYHHSGFRTSFNNISTAPKIKSVSEVLKSKHVGQVKVQGWVEAIRKMKKLIFVDIQDGSDLKKLQLTLDKDAAPPDLSYGSSVSAIGSVTINQDGKAELAVEEIKVLGTCPPVSEGYPLAARQPYNSNHLRQYLSLRLRAPPFRALLRVRHRAHSLLHDILDAQDFTLVHTPLLTANDCEGAGEVFRVQPDCEQLITEMRSADFKDKSAEEVFFGRKAFLTVSGQLHLEAAARAMNRVYSFGPIFRAENSKSRLHLAEFYMLEAEMAFVDGIENVTKMIERIMKRLIRGLLDSCSEDILLYRKLTNRPTEPDWLEHLDQMVVQSFAVISYADALQMLTEATDEKFKSRPQDGTALSKEHELYLVKRNGNLPLFVVEWPADLKPFYARPCRGLGLEAKVEAVDLLCPIVGEVCGGSVREDDLCRLAAKLSDAELSQKLDWYLDLRRYGNVTTAGFGAGFERILQMVLGTTNIKDAIPFPRWPHNCQL